MERREIAGIAIAFFLAAIVLVTCAILTDSQSNVSIMHLFQHYYLLTYAPILGAITTSQSNKRSKFVKQAPFNRRSRSKAKISIFVGRGAVRNIAIFRILVDAGPLSIGDIQRRLNRIRGLEVTYYASLNKRIHVLERGGYIGEVKPTTDQATGFKVCRYDLRTKFYLAYYLKGKRPDEILSRLNDLNATVILSELINAESTEV